MPLDLSDADRKALAKDLAAELETGRYGNRAVLSRRQLLSLAGGSAGVAGLVALGVDPATAQSAAGQVGTESEPVDVEAASVAAQSVNTDELNNTIHYARNDAELDDALATATDGDEIFVLGSVSDDRTIDTRVTIGFAGHGFRGADISGDWTLNDQIKLVGAQAQSAVSLTVASGRCAVTESFFSSNCQIIVQGSDFRYTNNFQGDVTFESGASSGLVDGCIGSTATDNDGGNTIGDIS